MYHHIWWRGEDTIDRGHRFSLNVSRFINNWLQSKLKSYGLSFRAFKGSCITTILVSRLCVEITNGNNLKEVSCRNSVQGQIKVIAEAFKVTFGLVWRPAQRNIVANFISKFYFEGYKFIKVMNVAQFRKVRNSDNKFILLLFLRQIGDQLLSSQILVVVIT